MRNSTAVLGIIVSVSLLVGCSVPICEEIPGLCGPSETGAVTDDGGPTETGSSGDDVGESDTASDSGPTEPSFCGGFAGFPCPDGLVCIDDPSDDCDPLNGGADCGGLCVEPGTCDAVLPAFHAETQRIRSCVSDDECGQELVGTSCGCTRNWVARADADLSDWSALLEEVNALGCNFGGTSTCDCPIADGFACVEGTCTWNYTDAIRR